MNWADFFNDPAVHSTLFYLRKRTKTCSLAAAHAPSCFPTKKVLGPKNNEKQRLNLQDSKHSEINIEKANFANFSNSFLMIMLKQVITS